MPDKKALLVSTAHLSRFGDTGGNFAAPGIHNGMITHLYTTNTWEYLIFSLTLQDLISIFLYATLQQIEQNTSREFNKIQTVTATQKKINDQKR